MNHLVSVLSAEAKHRERLVPSEHHEDESSSEEDEVDEATALRVHTLEGKVARVRGLTEQSTVAELRRAVEAQVGVAVESQRLYLDSSEKTHHVGMADHGSLELLNDGSRVLGDLGVFPARRGEQPLAAVHLRNRQYEALRSQLAVATEVVEDVLEQHYDKFNDTIAKAQTIKATYDNLAQLVADSRKLVAEARAGLGLRHPNDRTRPLLEDDGDEEDTQPGRPKIRILEDWEQVVEADEALALLAELRELCLRGEHSSSSNGGGHSAAAGSSSS